ncbi:pseudouridine synthase [Halolactibacillus alkaliphilus]|uniref:Pseudouridine synthase n=1 Tax=Halolactibacillus alkaliphilus TaxID=442899 RepID=A0A511X539_9BACI|nr:pseudouridine synthase [Halolactibacillus alkaliphilus]GEN58025.1 pseudouridine synthase [Halolactibacillus alkaliphilus]GGN72284.1 pseudouridine synthase [Halolactibacillus alkaliphilus]SFO89158.1 ribosomal small subunit pseudouridine synthase A [Halolactibacillus alkaliphilus]
MRIDKLLANSGFGSRKEVKQILKQGQVTVNGVVIKQPKEHVKPESDRIEVLGETLVYQEFVYFMMNKPPGVVSATEDMRDETVIDLLEPTDQVTSPFPVGRLDKDTEGLLLITNDGKLAHQLLSPKKDVGKCYYAKIDGKVTEEDIEVFKAGVVLDDGYKTKPAELMIISSDDVSEIELVISEGKFHQVKRMFEAVGKQVTYLKRLRMGSLPLDPSLDLGEYRPLTEVELAYLKEIK